MPAPDDHRAGLPGGLPHEPDGAHDFWALHRPGAALRHRRGLAGSDRARYDAGAGRAHRQSSAPYRAGGNRPDGKRRRERQPCIGQAGQRPEKTGRRQPDLRAEPIPGAGPVAHRVAPVRRAGDGAQAQRHRHLHRRTTGRGGPAGAARRAGQGRAHAQRLCARRGRRIPLLG